MPTFTPLGAKIKLVTYDLHSSTSAKLHKSKQYAAHDLHRSEQAALSAAALVERHIPYLDDTTRLHFLDDVPFYLVEAQTDSQALRLEERVKAVIQQRRGGYPPLPTESKTQANDNVSMTPQALGIVITLPKDVFVESFHQPANLTKGLPTFKRSCIKYDVFFNGDHAISDFQSSRYAHGSTGTKPTFDNGNIRIVTGKRVNVLFERPWVVVTTGCSADGSLRSAPIEAVDADQRWNAIGRALLHRANEQGYNEHRERSPLGKYLANLAAMKIPDEMSSLQEKTGHRFGVIDVVITAGRGQKGAMSHHYLHGPERLVEPNYTALPIDGLLSEAEEKMSPEPKPAQEDEAANNNQFLRGLAATAAFNRAKRTVTQPASYKDTTTRKTKTDTPSSTATPTPDQTQGRNESPGRTSILPAFPSVPEIDFNDAIAITPTKAEEIRGNRGIRDGSPTLEINRLFDPAKKMVPPLTIPRSVNKRRRSEKISISSESTSPTKAGAVSARPGGSPGSKSVSGYMGMTKRGIFSKSGSANASALLAADVSSTPPIMTNGSAFTVNRVIILVGHTPVLDKKLKSPYVLREDEAVLRTSPYQPLDESIVFPKLGQAPNISPHAKASPRQSISSSRNLRSNRVNGSSPKGFGPFVSSKTLLSTDATSREVTDAGASSIPNSLVSTKPAIATSPFVNLPVLLPSPAVSTPVSAAALATSTLFPKLSENPSTPSSAKTKPDTHDAVLAEECAKWRLPDLCDDCVITYTAEGPWLESGGGPARGGVMRHMKSARAGVFTENEVVFAVRYIVAGR